MNLYILRHASAGSTRQNPLLDRRRPLDKEGKQHCLKLAQVLSAQRTSFDVIVSSPLKRALQTAQLVGTEMGYEAKIVLSDALAPEAELPAFLQLLADYRDRESVLVVGHNPNLQGFLGALLVPRAPADHAHNGAGGHAGQESGHAAGQAAGHAAAPAGMAPANVRLRKGSLARLSMSRGPAMLQALLDPRTVRALYATSTKSSRRKISRK